MSPEPRLLLGRLAYVESPRWHEGRIWFAHWGTDEIVAVNLDGTSEVVARGPGGLGWSIDWLPDGRLLVTGAGLSRVEADGSLIPHADLGHLAGDWNELVVDGRGNIYVNGGLFGPPEYGPSGIIALVTAEGTLTSTAGSSGRPRMARPGSSPSSRPAARSARWPTGSPSPTAWSSRRTTAPSSWRSRGPNS